jgi:tellurite resistance protein TerC
VDVPLWGGSPSWPPSPPCSPWTCSPTGARTSSPSARPPPGRGLGRLRHRLRRPGLERLRRRVGQQYFAGYVIEKSLAVDNVFVWAIIFTYFAVPREYQHRVLFLGVLGALVFRGAFIAGGSVLIDSFSWVLYLFAAFLLYTGYRMVRQRNEHLDPEASRALRLFRRYVPMTDAYHGQRFFVRRGGVLLATPLLAVLVLVEITDVVFAVDSIPAIFAVTDEAFLVFTANAFAILGLRAMYFLLADLIHRFVYLKLGLALVLVWVGIKMLLKVDVLYIPTTVSLAVIVTILTVSVVASLRATRGQGRQELPTPPTSPFRRATEAELAELEPTWRRRRGPRPDPAQRPDPAHPGLPVQPGAEQIEQRTSEPDLLSR